MGLQGFERGLERMVEGVFARAFRSACARSSSGGGSCGRWTTTARSTCKGRTVVPNHFTFAVVGRATTANFAEIDEALVRELADAAREHARDERYAFMGPVEVELVDRRAPAARAASPLSSRMQEGQGGGAPAPLVLPTGERVTLGDKRPSDRPPARVRHHASPTPT